MTDDLAASRQRAAAREIERRKKKLAADMAELIADAEHWNRTHPDEEPIVIDPDISEDVERAMAKPDTRTFPVLWQGGRAVTLKLEALECPRSVPWAFVADHTGHCERNHGQTVDGLASRGGLAPCEMVAVVEGRRWHRMTDEDAVARLKTLLAKAAVPQ